MKTGKSSLFLFLIALGWVGTSAYGRSPLKLLDVKAGSVRVSPAHHDSSIFFDLGWTPLLDTEPVGIRGEISFTGAKNAQNERFYITNYEAYALISLISIFAIEAGGGMQIWHDKTVKSAPVVSVGFMFRIGEFIDRLYVDVSYVAISGNPTRVIKSGFGFNL